MRWLLLGLAVTAIVGLLFATAGAFKPAWFLDVRPRQLGSSLARATDAPGGGVCRPNGTDGHYSCGTEIDPGSGAATSYSLIADEDGCWTAERIRKHDHSPDTYSGCAGILDWILPKDVSADVY